MLNKKSIVLSGVDNSSKRAVLTLENSANGINGRLRLYNFGLEPLGIITLGIYQKGNVFKAGLIKISEMLYSFASDIKDISENFSCAVINFVNGEPRPILYGTSEGYDDQEKIFGQVINSLSEAKNVEEVEHTLDKFGVDYDDELKSEINEEIDKCISEESIEKCEGDCENCEYKKFYFSQIKVQELENSQENNNDEIDKKEDEIQGTQTFYLEMKSQLDDLFANNPNEEYLQELLPNSKWVKVSIDENGNYYVLGLIYEGDVLQYICYGVPGVYQKIPPRELSGFPVWFPLDQTKPQGFGYWLSYQDAESGESVKAVIVE